jgi:sugar phosphate permease
LVAGVGAPLTMSHLVGLIPSRARGTALGLRFTGNRAGQTVLPLAAGAVAADAGVSSAFLLLAALLGGCAVLLRREDRAARHTGPA